MIKFGILDRAGSKFELTFIYIKESLTSFVILSSFYVRIHYMAMMC
ncbi:hypothetical protein [Enterococcus italicus]